MNELNHEQQFKLLLEGETLVDSCGEEYRLEGGTLIHSDPDSLEYRHIYTQITPDSTLKKPEPKKIYLYETYDHLGNLCLCNKDGLCPDFLDKKMIGYFASTRSVIRKQNIIKTDKPIMVLNAETWERINE